MSESAWTLLMIMLAPVRVYQSGAVWVAGEGSSSDQ